MTAAFFGDDWFGQLALAVLCYLGILLYATSTTLRGVRQATQELVVTGIFAALWPIPDAPKIVYACQIILLFLGLAALGVLQVRFALLRNRAVLAYAEGRPPEPITVGQWMLILAPAVAVTARPIIDVIVGLVRSGAWEAPVARAELSTAVTEGLGDLLFAALAYGGYMAAAWVLDQAWLRSVGRIRLLLADARFVWINLSMGILCVVTVTFVLALGTTHASGYAMVAIAALSLIPGINGLSWVYDAALRRIAIVHVLFVAAAVLVVGIHFLSSRLSIPDGRAWWIALPLVVLLALVLPSRVDALLERVFFPRSGRMRARLVEIASEPLRAGSRADAAAELLERIVQVLDCEGGILVVDPVASAPAVLHCLGRVDAGAIGANAAEAAQCVAGLPLARGPCVIEELPLAHQLRMLAAGVVFVCPLRGRRVEATLLLGPRRGWLYDVATVGALRVFASQAGLALENLALVGARAHAEKLAALGEAAARIAHEIRNPLSAARSLMQLAGEADGVRTLTSPAITELDRIGQLVSDLLAFARREEPMNRAPVDLSAVCRSALRQVEPLAHEAGVNVQTSITTATVEGDANRLVQVVANLCRNAIEALATSATTRRMDVRCLTRNGSAYVEVHDTGPGIPAADLSRIFEPFATTKNAGTGLGLSIARRIVEAHGGRIQVESTRESDTVFRVVLPLLQSIVRG